jgi:hypothetical protein
MRQSRYYFSIQYSAIQKTILRHDRLWSIAGISAMLSQLNEIDMPAIASAHEGKVLLAGGGKFTASFPSMQQARDAEGCIVKAMATTLPMLEYQTSEIVEAESLRQAKEKGLLNELRRKKNAFRGYGVTFNPHLRLCEECRQYPSIDEKSSLCAVCSAAKARARHHAQRDDGHSQKITLDRIYDRYLERVSPSGQVRIPFNFDDLFPKAKQSPGQGPQSSGDINRMAVWFSDLNNMKHKVILWSNQQDDFIRKTFDDVKSLNADIIAQTLCETFPRIDGDFIPFRLIVAGGDDLCLAMDARSVLSFALNLSKVLYREVEGLKQKNPMHPILSENLRTAMARFQTENPSFGLKLDVDAPYCFGAGFIIASTHTPFSKIHAVGERLMGLAKMKSRAANSVHWAVMPEMTHTQEQVAHRETTAFDKPLFIDRLPEDDKPERQNRLTLADYASLTDQAITISGAHRQQIAKKLAQANRDYPALAPEQSDEIERWLKTVAATELKKDFDFILNEPHLREAFDGQVRLAPGRIATLLELTGLTGK